MKCAVTVYDKRCDNGLNTRTKDFQTLEECLKWARSIKNAAFSQCIVFQNEDGKMVARAYNRI